jgi:methionyl-tRNA formyltransferase
MNPAPGAWFAVGDERVKVLGATVMAASDPLSFPGERRGNGSAGEVLDADLTIACGEGAIRPTLVQRAGRGVTSAADLLRGFSIPAGTLLA